MHWNQACATKPLFSAGLQTNNVELAEYTDLKVTLFGRTAIPTGTFIGKGANPAGRPLDVRVRFTDTWVKMAYGKGLCVATHDSLLKM
jgi:hypothetical protein